MRCPQCSYISFDQQDHCLKCSSDLSAIAEEFKGTGLNVESPFFLGGVLGEAEAVAETSEASFDDEAVDLVDLDVDSLSTNVEMGGDLEYEADLDLSIPAGEEDGEEPALQSLGLDDLDVADLMPAMDEEVPGLDLNLADDEDEADTDIVPELEPKAELDLESEGEAEPLAELSLDQGDAVDEADHEIEFSLDAEPALEPEDDGGVEEPAAEMDDDLQGGIEMELPELDDVLPSGDDDLDLDLSLDFDEQASDSIESNDPEEGGIVDLSALMGFGDSDDDEADDLDLGLSLKGDNDLTSVADSDVEQDDELAPEIPDLNLSLEGDDDK